MAVVVAAVAAVVLAVAGAPDTGVALKPQTRHLHRTSESVFLHSNATKEPTPNPRQARWCPIFFCLPLVSREWRNGVQL